MLSEERPYEKCERFGAGSLTDIELLAVLLRTGTKGESALDLARKLFYPGEGTQPQAKAHLQSWTKEELLKISGIGRVKAIQILCLCELSKRMSQLSAREASRFFKTGYNCSILYGRYALLQAGAFETADAEYAFQTDRRKRNFERDSKYVRNFPERAFYRGIAKERSLYYIVAQSSKW